MAPRTKPGKSVKAAAIDPDVARWVLQIELAERRQEAWERRCENIIKRYRDERRDGDAEVRGISRFNIFWSNVQTLKPCLYAKDPHPVVERRYLDRDDTGRVASTILERAIRYQISDGFFTDAMERAVLDYLLIGRGVTWHRFKPAFGVASSIDDEGDDELRDVDGLPGERDEKPDYQKDADREGQEETFQTPQERILDAAAEIEYLHWRDFLHSEARTWKEVMWIARRIHMTRKDLVDWFGEKVGNEVPLQEIPEQDKAFVTASTGDRASEVFDDLKKAMVYEIWCKWDRKVYFVAKGYDNFLKEPIDDPLNLEGFWPTPQPLFATLTNDSLQPVPDYVEYQDQALELDDLTKRIDLLLRALKVAGVYDGSNRELARLLDEGHENKLIAVANWAEFLGKTGGLAKAIDFIPLDMIANVLKGLFEARDRIKQDLYEITGLADVIRGQADPRETATSVATKGRWGSLRLQDRQRLVARFARDNIALMGEIISEHFPDDILILTSGIDNDEGVGDPIPPMPSPPKPAPMPAANPMGMPQPASLPAPVASSGIGIPAPSGPVVAANGAMPPVSSPGGVAPAPAPGPSPQAAYLQAMLEWHQQAAQIEGARQALIGKAIGLLRSDKLRGFRIDIETDSTIAEDSAQEKADRVEFVKAASSFIEQMVTASEQLPELMPLAAKMMMFAVRGFRTGRDLEASMESFIEKLEKDLQEKEANPQQSPAQMKEMADAQKAQAEVKAQQVEAASEMQNSEMRMKEKQLDFQMAQFQAQTEAQKLQQQAQYESAKHEQRMKELAIEQQIAAARQMHEISISQQPHPNPHGFPQGPF